MVTELSAINGANQITRQPNQPISKDSINLTHNGSNTIFYPGYVEIHSVMAGIMAVGNVWLA